MSPARERYDWIPVDPEKHHFLGRMIGGLGLSSLRLWIDADIASGSCTRTDCAGLVTAVGQWQGHSVAIVWSDFRVNAASYGQANSRRFVAFLQHLERGGERIPLIYFVNSAGLSVMEGRTGFAEAFAIWPALLRHAERHLVLTCALGRCLGLAPLLFGLGHYRVAVANQTQLNLTGPEVIKLFFGDAVDFDQVAAAERFVETTDLIHELVPSVDAACARFKALLAPDMSAARPDIAGMTGEILASFLDAPPQELVPGWCNRMRLFVGTRHGTPVGLFVNPPDRSDNLITVRTLDKYAAGIDLFGAMHLPIVSFLDSPGFDPRVGQSAANNFRRMLWVGEKIIRYPYGTMGVVTSRCFGGAATLGFPKVFGGARAVALRGARMGVMQASIVEKLLSGCPRLREQWRGVALRQTAGLDDLLANGTVDAVVDLNDLGAEIDHFLARVTRPLGRVTAARHVLPFGRQARARAS